MYKEVWILSYTNDGILLIGTNFNEILIEIYKFLF